MIEVPDGVAAARWAVEELGGGGSSFLAGPSDYRLLALLLPPDDDGWPRLEQALGAPAGERTMVVTAEAAKLVLDVPADGRATVSVTGPGYDPMTLSSARFRVDAALRAGGGVLVSAVTS